MLSRPPGLGPSLSPRSGAGRFAHLARAASLVPPRLLVLQQLPLLPLLPLPLHLAELEAEPLLLRCCWGSSTGEGELTSASSSIVIREEKRMPRPPSRAAAMGLLLLVIAALQGLVMSLDGSVVKGVAASVDWDSPPYNAVINPTCKPPCVESLPPPVDEFAEAGVKAKD